MWCCSLFTSNIKYPTFIFADFFSNPSKGQLFWCFMEVVCGSSPFLLKHSTAENPSPSVLQPRGFQIFGASCLKGYLYLIRPCAEVSVSLFLKDNYSTFLGHLKWITTYNFHPRALHLLLCCSASDQSRPSSNNLLSAWCPIPPSLLIVFISFTLHGGGEASLYCPSCFRIQNHR